MSIIDKSKTLFDKRFAKSYKEIIEIVEALRVFGQKIVLTQGSWDLLHIGHAKYLERASEYGDVLIVGVDSDEKIKVRKGPGRPVVPEEERLELLCHVRSVGFVVLKPAKEEKWSLIMAIKPDVLVATAETYTEEELDKLLMFCGDVVVLDRQAETSTSAQVRRAEIKRSKERKNE